MHPCNVHCVHCRYRIWTAQSVDQVMSLLDNLPLLPDVLLVDCEGPAAEAALKVCMGRGGMVRGVVWEGGVGWGRGIRGPAGGL